MVSFLIKQPRKFKKFRLIYKTISTGYIEFESLNSLKQWEQQNGDSNDLSWSHSYTQQVEKI